MSKGRRRIMRFFVASAVLKGIAVGVSRLFERDSTASVNDFKVLAVMDGRELDSEADSLRTGSATSFMGGIDIDLTKAKLDPGGAHVALKAIMGGIRLIVPDEWRVDVDLDVKGGDATIHTSDPADAPEGAPRLFVEAYTRMGGILIEPAD